MDRFPGVLRSPRVFNGQDAVALLSLLRQPTFKVKMRKSTMSIEFRHEFCLKEVPAKYRALYEIFFYWGQHRWADTITKTHATTRYNRTSARSGIFKLLHHILKESLRTWLNEAWSLKAFSDADRLKQLDVFAKEVTTQSGPKPNPIRGVIAAQLSEEIGSKVRGLRSRIGPKKAHSMKDEALIAEIRKSGLTLPAVIKALQKTVAESKITGREFFGKRPSSTEIVNALLKNELKVRRFNLKKFNQKTYVKHGRRIIKDLDYVLGRIKTRRLETNERRRGVKTAENIEPSNS